MGSFLLHRVNEGWVVVGVVSQPSIPLHSGEAALIGHGELHEYGRWKERRFLCGCIFPVMYRASLDVDENCKHVDCVVSLIFINQPCFSVFS